MSTTQAIILAIIQAFTEFLPVSSSAHLALASYFFGGEYQGVTFDLAMHFGTLIAILIYFRQDVIDMAVAVLQWRPGQTMTARQKLGFGIALATIPAVIVGGLMGESGALVMRHPVAIGINLIVFGVLLALAERHSRRHNQDNDQGDHDNIDGVLAKFPIKKQILVGVAQAMALMPGVSRSGATMTAGMFMNLPRSTAARYSFLLSIPVMILATAHGAMSAYLHGEVIEWKPLLIGLVTSAVVGLAVIHFFLKIIKAIGVMPFVVYRILLGAAVLIAYFLM